MTAHEIIEEARFRALLEVLSPKKRLKFLRRVTQILGDPAVVPCATMGTVRPIAEAKAMWARILPLVTR